MGDDIIIYQQTFFFLVDAVKLDLSFEQPTNNDDDDDRLVLITLL